MATLTAAMHGSPAMRIAARAQALAGIGLGLLAGHALQLQQAVVSAAPQGRGLAIVCVVAGLVLCLVAWTSARWAWQGARMGWHIAASGVSLRQGAGAGSARLPSIVAALAFAGGGLLAWGQAEWRASLRLAIDLPAPLIGEDLRVVGRIDGLPVRRSDGTRFRFTVESAEFQGRQLAVPQEVPREISLGWYRGLQDGALLAAPAAAPRSGERWRFTVRLRRVQGPLNPHGFDFELWMFEQGLRASGSVRATLSDAAERLDEPESAGPWPDLAPQALRQRVRDRLDAYLAARIEGTAGAPPVPTHPEDASPQTAPGGSAEITESTAPAPPAPPSPAAPHPDVARAGVVAALAIGDQSAIERSDWDLFRATGIAHLVSISGLHVTMFAWLAAAVVRTLWRRSARACLWLPARRAGLVGGVLLATGYALLAGWGVPAQRTVCMLAVVAALRAAGLRWPWPMVLLAAATVVSLADPWALLQPGFWLSFVAVALLLLTGAEPLAPGDPAPSPGLQDGQPPHAGFRRAVRRLAQAAVSGIRTQCIATIGLAPLSLLFFQQASGVGLLANLVAIPLVTLAITPLALLGCLWPPAWGPAFMLVGALTSLLEILAGWPWALWHVPAPPGAVALAGLIGAALWVAPLPWRWRLLGLPMGWALLAWPGARPAPGHYELIAADIGQGNAVLVRTARHTLLYDSGPAYARDSDAGSRVLLPLLHALGETRLDRLVLSHRDLDHTGGAAALLRALPVHEVLSSLEPGHRLVALAGARHRRCEAGQAWTWDGVRFELLHPSVRDYRAAEAATDAAAIPPKPNTLSCVLRIGPPPGPAEPAGSGADAPATAPPATAPPATALLAGDIERPQELGLLDSAGAALDVDLLLVPHHGSRTSSTQPFLEAVSPVLALVQAGAGNRFGHPAPEVVRRYRDLGVRLLRTDQCGAWRWNGAKIDAKSAASAASWCERERARRYWHAVPPAVPRP